MPLVIPRPRVVAGDDFGFPGHQFEHDTRLAPVMFPIMSGAAVFAAVKKRVLSRFGRTPRHNFYFFDGMGQTCRAIRESSASWKALHLLYNHPFDAPSDVSGMVDNFLLASPNAQAVRNRRKIAVAEIHRAALRLGKPVVRMFAIAAGSAQSELEAMLMLRQQNVRLECLMIDKEMSACEHAAYMAAEHGLTGQFQARVALAGDKTFLRLLKSYQPDMVEMLGLLDYLEDSFAARLLAKIREALPSGGTFFTCNVCPNPERRFLKHVINWDMIYRSGEQLKSVMLAAGFADDEVRILHEPLGIHGLAICQKK